jgi:hypothetical protein
MRGDEMIGGYAVVAAELNRVYAPQPAVTRQHVHGWFYRGTRNYEGQLPPGPVQEVANPPRTQARYLFRTADWITWYGKGMRGPNRRGWVKWVPVDTGRKVETLAAL